MQPRLNPAPKAERVTVRGDRVEARATEQQNRADLDRLMNARQRRLIAASRRSAYQAAARFPQGGAR